MESSIIDNHWIAISGEIRPMGFKCSLINLYNPCSISDRCEVWKSLCSFQFSSKVLCLLVGDFNEVLDINDRTLHKGNNTWYRGHSKSKLDRLFISPEWLLQFRSLKVSLLKRTISDHCPLHVYSREKNWGPRPFRFLNCWLQHPNCLKLIEESWSSNANLPIVEKLRKVKSRLREWNSKEFGQIDLKIKALENRIHELDLAADIRDLSNLEVRERKEAQVDLWSWLKKKESYWAQLSRNRWLKEGDENTRYCHAVASMNKKMNTIESIEYGEGITEDPCEIKKEAVNFFKKIFKEDCHQRPVFHGLEFSTLSGTQGQNLIERFSRSEIDQAVASCDASKAPGPNGFNFAFIKNSWEVIKLDVYDLVNKFWKTSRLPKGCNTAFIALIPKSKSPSKFSDYRPISMVGCLYKIIAKLLARRLQGIMDSLIGAHQSAFIKGRQILDGALIASEVVASCKRNKTQAVLLKLDFHKAFDSISWSYLDWVLAQMNFPPKWREWMHSCVMSASASILINGSPSSTFKLQRGLRQGDPLSPFLFNLAVEPLNLLIQKSVSLGLWSGIEICRNGTRVSHLQYADDTLVFCEPNIQALLNIKRSLILFQLSSGLQTNFHKSFIFGINVDNPWLLEAAKALLC